MTIMKCLLLSKKYIQNLNCKYLINNITMSIFRSVSSAFVINGSNLNICCFLFSLLQIMTLAAAPITLAEVLTGTVSISTISSELDHPNFSPNDTPPQSIDSLSDSSKKINNNEINTDTEGIDVPEKRDLASLVGASEISVFADVDGQFVSNMAKNQVMEGEFASAVSVTNLLESVRAGRSFNRESLEALAREEQAKAQSGQALSFLLPSVTVRYSRGYETSEPSVEENVAKDTHLRTDIAFTVRQPLFDLPSFLDWRRRKVTEQVRAENYRVSDGDAYVSAVNVYLSLVSSRLQAEMTREFETQLMELLHYIEKRANAGAASVSDMERVKARSQATLSSRLEQESAHAAAGVEFIRLTNLVPEKVRLPDPEDIGASQLPESLDQAVAIAMRSNPEIAGLMAEVKEEKIDVLAAKSKFLPRVDAEYTDAYSHGAGGARDDVTGKLEDQRDQRSMLVLNWALFSGGRDYKYHAERVARQKELLYRLDGQRRRVVQTLSANYAILATTRQRIASGYQELESISMAANAMSKRMLSGNQSLLDLLDVYDRYYQVRTRLVSLHVLEMTTVAQLVRLTYGTPGASLEPAPLVQGNPNPTETISDLKEKI